MAFPTASLFDRYEAKDEVGYSDTDPVTTTTDQSGNSRDLVNGAGENDPEYKTGILNGEAIYRYDGANSEAHILTGTGVTGATAFTVSVVVSAASEGSSRTWVFAVHDGTGTIFGFTEGEVAGEWQAFVKTTAGTQKIPTSGVDTTVDTTLTLVWNGTTAEFFVDGSSVGTANIGGSFNPDDISIGDVSTLSQYFSGDIALAASWNKALDSTERADLHTYVQDTYGITVSDYNGTTTESISGTSAGTSTDTAGATVNVTGTATSAGTSTDTGALTATASVSGTSAGTSADTGVATSATRITGTSAGTSTDTGAVTTSSQGAAAGTSAGTSTDTAAATVTASLSGTSAGLSADSVAAIATAALGGTSPGSSVDTTIANLMAALTATSAGTSADSGTATFGTFIQMPPFVANAVTPNTLVDRR